MSTIGRHLYQFTQVCGNYAGRVGNGVRSRPDSTNKYNIEPPELSNVSSLRQRIAILILPPSCFDNFVLAAIFLNSIFLVCVDYRFVDDKYQLSTDLQLGTMLSRSVS